MTERKPDDYDIFNDFDILETLIGQMDLKYAETNTASFCENIKCQSHNENEIKVFCKMFAALFIASKEQCNIENKELKEKNYLEFMNYFMNHKLNESGYTKTEKENFYREVTSKYSEFNNDSELKKKMFVINEKYLISLHILYKLYENYDKLCQKKVDFYNNIVKEMKSQYNYGLEKCFYDGEIKFCEALEKFRNDYEKDKKSNSVFCKVNDNKYPKLPEITLISKSSLRSLSIAIIGNELFKRSYNPTLNKYSIETPEKYYNLKDLIFVQYNLRMEKDEEDKKLAMMRILHQFIQYCNENKANMKLASFIKEFIEEYYDKKKTEYQAIFNECKKPDNEKKYCTLYKECDNSFKKDLKIIEEKTHEYITEQENYFNSLTELDFLLWEAKAMFQDFEKMSKYLPTIMSTMVAIVVFLFFLYKLAPHNSIFRKGEKKRKKIPLFFPERIKDLNDDNTGHKNAKPKRGKIHFSYQPT
ncbi:VIR protein [Plasmodium vivax]|uniref:VIR protein n=1 Tax=Plasmodium vivax TaxID=5855 RepID=A0A1G4E494_PLAVI|nr:VIR protein [Plasmodium vivax]